jgi:hypothetical protein
MNACVFVTLVRDPQTWSVINIAIIN